MGPASSMDGCNEVLYIGVNFAKLVGMTWHGLSTPHVPYIGAALMGALIGLDRHCR